MVSLLLNSLPVQFKIDTGADVSAIPESVFHKLSGVALHPATKPLRGPAEQPLEARGQFKGTLAREPADHGVTERIFVIRGLETALVGRPAIEAMGLVSRVSTIQEGERYAVMYPDLFKGLGTLEGDYHIRLRQDAKPFALSTPRRVALPLLPKVKQELERMEAMGVITRVEEPTEWCSGMVVVPKANGSDEYVLT